MKKILVLTVKELIDRTAYICEILKNRYREKFIVETLKSMDEKETASDYVYIIITHKTTQEEIDLLMSTALLWTNNDNVNISYLNFETIKNAEIKKQKRRESTLRRKYSILNNTN